MRTLIALLFALTYAVSANATSIYIQNASYGSGTIDSNGTSVTWNTKFVNGQWVGFRTEGSTMSPYFSAPQGVTLTGGRTFSSPDGQIGAYQASCVGGESCVVSFRPDGTSTVTRISGVDLSVTAVFNDGTWMGNGDGPITGQFGSSSYTKVGPSAFGVFAGVKTATGLLGVGSIFDLVNDAYAIAGRILDNTFTPFSVTTADSAAFGVSSDGSWAVGDDGGFVSRWNMLTGNQSLLPMYGQSGYQRGTAFSMTSTGAIAGYDENGVGFVYLPYFGGTVNVCSAVLLSGQTLPSGQSVANCTLGRTDVAEFGQTYSLFAQGSVFVASNLNPTYFNSPGWQGGSPVPEPATSLLGLVSLSFLASRRARGLKVRVDNR